MFSRARTGLAAISAPVLCLLLVTASAHQRTPPAANPPLLGLKPRQPTVVDRRLSRGEYIAREALSYRGTPYRFGGESRNGIDCSGLTQTVMKELGLLVPRTSVEQFKTGLPISKPQMKPGDLVFFKNTYKKGISHVGIFIGEGKFVHAASKKKGVIVSALTEPYWHKRWAGARRVDLEPIQVNA